MLSSKEKSRPACINTENLAQAIPIDSSRNSKSRIVLGREPIWDMGKNARQNLSLSSSQSLFVLSTANVYHCFAFPVREKENNFHLRVSCVMPEMLRHEHISSNSCRWWLGFHFQARRRVVPKPWLLNMGGVHNQMTSLVLKVAQGTPPLKRKGCEMLHDKKG